MRTKILTTTYRNDIADTRQRMFNVNRMKSLVSRGASTTDFRVGNDRYQVATAIATLAGYVAGYATGYQVSLTAIFENDKPVNKTVVLEVDNIIMAYAYPGNSAYTTIHYVDPSQLTERRVVVNTTLALVDTACNTVSGSGTAAGRAKAFAKVTAVADTPQAVTFADPVSGGAVTMGSANYILLVNGFDADGPVDVKVSSIGTGGFTLTASANCSVYYAVFE